MKCKKITASVLSIMLAAGTVALPLGESYNYPYAVTASAANSIVFEAEDAYVSGGSIVNKTGYSGGKAVQMGEGYNIVTFKINVPEDGKYNFTINSAGNNGDKKNVFTLNGSVLGEISSKNGTVESYTVNNINLKKGENTITVGDSEKSWGWIFIDSFSIEKVENYDSSAQYKVKNVLSNPNATTEAKSVYSYICDNFGKKVLSGQQEGCGSNKDTEMEYIQSTTGKLPVIRGLDFMNNDFDGVVERAKKWWDNGNGGIVTICWHTGIESSGYDESKSDPFPDDLLDHNSENYKKMIASWDKAADALKKLQDEKVPVLWRPFHEFDGQWFWWGKAGNEKFKALWKEMYNYFTEEKGLNNLIWVLGYAGDVKDNWYVGNDYCDIIGSDTYAGGTNKAAWDKLIKLNASKPVAFHECGEIPSVQDMENYDDLWSWFMCWHSSGDENWLRDYNTDLSGIYNSDLVITKDELPEGGLKVYGSNDPVISLNTTKISIERGSTDNLKATTNNADGKKINWKSSDESVCTVDQNGQITAIKPGTATITATIDGTEISDACTVTVTNYAMTLDADNISVKVGKTTYIENPTTNAPDAEFEFVSADENICTVDSTGKITGISAGTTKITVTLKGYNVSADIKITVKGSSTDNSTITLDNSTLSIEAGKTSQLNANTDSKNGVTWSSDNTSVATVDSNGKVTAIKEGTAKITAKISNGKTAICVVTVTKANNNSNSGSNPNKKPSSVTPSKPQVATPSAVNGIKKTAVSSTYVKFKWNKAKNAKAYQVWLYTGGKWKLKTTVKSNSCKISGLKTGTNYYIRVRAVNGKTYGKYSAKVKFCTKPKAVSKVSLSSRAKKSVTAVFNKVSGASGYQIQITSSKKLKGGILRTTKKTKYTLSKKLKSRKTYYVRVRAYKTLGKTKYYGSWSKAKKIKIK